MYCKLKYVVILPEANFSCQSSCFLLLLEVCKNHYSKENISVDSSKQGRDTLIIQIFNVAALVIQPYKAQLYIYAFIETVVVPQLVTRLSLYCLGMWKSFVTLLYKNINKKLLEKLSGSSYPSEMNIYLQAKISSKSAKGEGQPVGS